MNYAFILESVGKKLKVSYDKHRRYKSLVSKILSEIYSDRILHSGIKYVRKQKFDTGEGDISILNKAIGNITILKWLYKTFLFESFPHLLNFVEKNKKELFCFDGKYFNEVFAILQNTENKGRENEELAIKYINNLMQIKGIKSEIKQTGVCSREDVIDGIDLILNSMDKNYFIQVKPLVSYKKKDNYFEIKSSGKLKNYPIVNYFIFVNDKEYLLFANRDIRIVNGEVYAPLRDLKNDRRK